MQNPRPMKKTPAAAAWLAASAVLLGAALFSVPAAAQYVGPTAAPVATSVQAILARPVDDQPVQLRGRIVRKLKDETYLFSDGKARIRVEIDDDLLHGLTLGPKTRVEITGEVDKDRGKAPEVDVKTLRVIR